ncbi:MAG: 4-alpha-glucanotransferase [Actinomycetota bacterium]|nr:4-alpha-glucanotransferase [Actinomycetota bacterium]
MDALTPQLTELAHAHGVATEFYDWRGQHVEVNQHTVVAVLAALGVPAETPEAVDRSLQAAHEQPWLQTLAPCTVVRGGERREIAVHVPHGDAVTVLVHPEDGGPALELEHVDRYVQPRTVAGRQVGEATVVLPADLPLGWHTIEATVGGPDGETSRAALVVTPPYLGLPPSVAGTSDATWGFMTQLYSVRSSRSWAHGDLDDLGELARWSAEDLGAGFVLVNPLHAPGPTPPIEPSPYLPVTRRFVSPLYVRVEDVTEFPSLGSAARAEIERLALEQRARNSADVLLDRDAVWEAKRSALSLLHAVPRSPGRQADYDAYLAREGRGLVDFATWCALAEVHGPVWSEWPEQLQSPASEAVAKAAAELAGRVDFYCWLQWVLDEQLTAAQQRAVDAGMPLGIVHDLAVGVHPDGADTWALQDVMGRGVTVGAPPDAFNQQGQDWSQPPWLPARLAQAGYAPFRDMLRTVLRHSGGIRVDHVLGLFRLWWVPEGSSPVDGTYVRFDHEALVGILALEAHRAGAVVVGEDLGNVEPWVRDYLAERGLLGTSILWFERDYAAGVALPPEQWRELTLASVTTHDLPPTAGYLAGEHLRIRDELGLLTRPIEEEMRIDAAERVQWLDLLVARGWLRDDARDDEHAVIVALHRALAATPCRLLGVALTDVVGDRRAINQPGTNDEYPNWRVPLADGTGRPVLLEALVGDARAATLATAVRGDDPA